MKTLLGSALIGILLSADLLLGNAALFLGVCVYGALYLAGAYGKSWGWGAALISGLVLDGIYHRPFCLTPAIFVAAASLGYFAAGRMHFRLPEAPLVSGGVVGLLLFFGNELAAALFGSAAPGPDKLSTLIFQVVFGMIFMLFLSALLDFCGRCAGMPLFERELLERSPRSRRIISRSALRGNTR